MDRTQANNFIGILRTALGNGQVPLEHPDWDKLAEWADLQSLPALFYTGACQFQEFAQWDGTKRQKLQRETIAGVVAQSTRTELFLDVYRSLLEKGQKPLVLKGVVVRQLYGELSDYRPSCDEDLYVRPEEAIPCRRELENLGFRITAPEDERKLSDPFQEVSLDHSSGMLHVELHPNFFERSREDLRLSNRYYQKAHDTAVPIHTGGTTLWTLDETHHFLYLFLHLAKHFKGAGVGLKQMVDLLVADRAWRDKICWKYIKQAVEKNCAAESSMALCLPWAGTWVLHLSSCSRRRTQPISWKTAWRAVSMGTAAPAGHMVLSLRQQRWIPGRRPAF